MGRGKIEIKRIENQTNRSVTFSKRRNGIIKKAKEITVLCDAKVSLIIFPPNHGKMSDYCSPNTTVPDILQLYHKCSEGKKLWDAKHENLSNEIDRIKKENDIMQIELRHLKGEDVNSLPYTELMSIEETLENGVACIRDRQDEIVKMYRKNQRMVEEENKYLHDELHRSRMALEASARGYSDDGYNNMKGRDVVYSSEMPFPFRVQPIQPNLQDRRM